MSWEELKDFSDYEINTEYPYPIRKKETGKILSEYIEHTGYYRLNLNGTIYEKHRIIANQWIANPDNLPCVDHKNKDRTDNHIENLRWVTYSENNRNRIRSSTNSFEFIDELPDDAFEFTEYSNHIFEDYYFSPSNDTFYLWTGIEYRILPICYKNNGSIATVSGRDIDRKGVSIYYTKFKRQYNLV